MPNFKFFPARDDDGPRARFFFRLNGVQYNRTIPIEDRGEAERKIIIIRDVIISLKRGMREIPSGADVAEYILNGGKAVSLPGPPEATPKVTTLGEMVAFYQAHAVKDPATSYTERIHLAHLSRVLKGTLQLSKFDQAIAQKYADRRLRETAKGRKTTTSPITVLKELKTFSIVWNWTLKRPDAPPLPGLVPFSLDRVEMAAEDPKPRFLTWDEIERTIKRGGLTEAEIDELWECLYLDMDQIRKLLEHIRSADVRPFLYPMACAAAYTGARRSELVRSLIKDWDFDNRVVHIRQKKAKRKRLGIDFRDVDLCSALIDVVQPWFANHSGGQHAFCTEAGGEQRADSATYYLDKALAGSKWEVVRGWHTFRHSFASNLARAGKDQRIIDEWMGHHTEIRLRYQHLFPDKRRDAIESLLD